MVFESFVSSAEKMLVFYLRKTRNFIEKPVYRSIIGIFGIFINRCRHPFSRTARRKKSAFWNFYNRIRKDIFGGVECEQIAFGNARASRDFLQIVLGAHNVQPIYSALHIQKRTALGRTVKAVKANYLFGCGTIFYSDFDESFPARAVNYFAFFFKRR